LFFKLKVSVRLRKTKPNSRLCFCSGFSYQISQSRGKITHVLRTVAGALIVFVHYAREQLLLSARLSHRNSVRLSIRLSVCPSVRHTGGSVKNGAS